MCGLLKAPLTPPRCTVCRPVVEGKRVGAGGLGAGRRGCLGIGIGIDFGIGIDMSMGIDMGMVIGRVLYQFLG